MASHETLKDHIKETALFSRRIVAALVVIVLLLGILLARMVYLQVIDHQHYTTLSQNNRVSVLPIAPPRGLIFDRNGIVLAQNQPSFTLELVPEKIDDLEQTLARLAEIIRIEPSDLARFHKLRKRRSAFKAVPLRFRLNEEEVARFSARGHLFPGVEIQARLTRQYPQGALAVHALGYVGRISEEELQSLDSSNYRGTTHIGKTGIEKYYEDQLHGTVGFRRVETSAQGRIIRVLEEQAPVPGLNLYLELDARVQAVAEAALGEQRGAVVAIDTRTGGVIALASMPGFDPNPFVNGIDSKTYAKLANSQEQPLFNRAIRGRYPPGSTIKPLIGLAALEYGVVRRDTRIHCPGWYTLPNDEHRYRDWKKTGHGLMSLRGAIRESCDVYFYDLARQLGIDRFHEYLSRFGLGQRTGIDLFGETRGLLPSREWKRRVKGEIWYPGETLITGIGQGFNLTSPLQLAEATATLANGGVRYRPRLAHYFQDQRSGDIRYLAPQEIGRVPVDNPENWRYIIDTMKDVVHNLRGTAHRIARGVRYKIAGKTGTAQVFGIKQDEEYVQEDVEAHLRDHALFIAFAPIEAPRIAVAVIVENGGSGGGVAAPIARKVLDQFLLGETP